MKLTSLFAILLCTPLAQAADKADPHLKLISLIETAFEKPVVVKRPSRVYGKDFNFNSFKLKKTNQGQEEYISNFLKLNEQNIIETKNEVHIVGARDAVKMHIPVFKEVLPKDLREQMVVVVKTIPRSLRNKSIDLLLRSHYSSDGDLKLSKDKNKIIISDWASNTKKMIDIIEIL